MPGKCLYTVSSCTLAEYLQCEGVCGKCGWNPRVALRRLRKKYTENEIIKLRKIPIVGNGAKEDVVFI